MNRLLYVCLDDGLLHVWIGPLGVHLDGKKLRNSRFDWEPNWREAGG